MMTIISNVNLPKWFLQTILLNIDRLSLIELVGIIELVIRHPKLPITTKEIAIRLGKTFALLLIKDGIILPDQVKESWEKSFKISIKPTPDLIIPELTDKEGRRWN